MNDWCCYQTPCPHLVSSLGIDKRHCCWCFHQGLSPQLPSDDYLNSYKSLMAHFCMRSYGSWGTRAGYVAWHVAIEKTPSYTAYISLLAYVSTRGQASSLTAFTLRWMCLRICFLWRSNGIWQARRACGGLISLTVPRKDWDWCRICIHLKQDEARLCSWLAIPHLLASQRSMA